MARPKESTDIIPRKQRIPYKSNLLVGKRIHRWLVLDVDNTNGHNIRLKVKCDCGTIAIRNYTTIAYGKSKSCGCYHSEELLARQIKADNEAAKRKLYNNYKSGAKIREIKFELTFEEVYDIASKPCYYCNKVAEREIITAGGSILVNGIDRVDNLKGYLIGNCVSCCSTCNLQKGNITKEIIEKAYKFLYE